MDSVTKTPSHLTSMPNVRAAVASSPVACVKSRICEGDQFMGRMGESGEELNPSRPMHWDAATLKFLKPYKGKQCLTM